MQLVRLRPREPSMLQAFPMLAVLIREHARSWGCVNFAAKVLHLGGEQGRAGAGIAGGTRGGFWRRIGDRDRSGPDHREAWVDLETLGLQLTEGKRLTPGIRTEMVRGKRRSWTSVFDAVPSVSAMVPVVPVDVQRRCIETFRKRENFRGGDTEDTAFGSTKQQMSQDKRSSRPSAGRA
jgi:hypothetical protein